MDAPELTSVLAVATADAATAATALIMASLLLVASQHQGSHAFTWPATLLWHPIYQ